MCHALLQSPSFYRVLQRIDEELAAEVRSGGCACGGALHRANYPRKPRGCLSEVRAEFSLRFSFCCNRCRLRTTSMSVRFLGRRVYLALVVVLASARPVGQIAAAARLANDLAVPPQTLRRWRQWWSQQFPQTSLWQAKCAHFIPPPSSERFPVSLLERFAADAERALLRLLSFLTPITARPVALNEVC